MRTLTYNSIGCFMFIIISDNTDDSFGKHIALVYMDHFPRPGENDPYEDTMVMTRCQDYILTENTLFVWSKTSCGEKWRCY